MKENTEIQSKDQTRSMPIGMGVVPELPRILQNEGFKWQTFKEVQLLVPKNLPPGVVAGFTASTGGKSGKAKDSLNLAFHVKDKQTNVTENWARFFRALHYKDFIESRSSAQSPGTKRTAAATAGVTGGDQTSLQVSLLDQEHTNVVKEIKNISQIRTVCEHGADIVHLSTTPADAQFTDHPGWILGVLTADCVPVLIYDKKGRACAAIHAGWQGTYRDITEKTINDMTKKLVLKPSDLYAAIGPAVGACCYEVDATLADKFQTKFSKMPQRGGQKSTRPVVVEIEPSAGETATKASASKKKKSNRYFVDLKEANRRQLIAAGIPRSNIIESTSCTMCGEENFFSFRRDKDCGRQLSFVMLRKS